MFLYPHLSLCGTSGTEAASGIELKRSGGRKLGSFGFSGLAFWLPSYLRTERHFPTEVMAGWASMSWLLAVIAVIVTGWPADRTQRPALMGVVVCSIAAVDSSVLDTTHWKRAAGRRRCAHSRASSPAQSAGCAAPASHRDGVRTAWSPTPATLRLRPRAVP